MRFLYAIAPATILGPLPKMVHKIVFTWKFYVFMLTVLLGKVLSPHPSPKNLSIIFIGEIINFRGLPFHHCFRS